MKFLSVALSALALYPGIDARDTPHHHGTPRREENKGRMRGSRREAPLPRSHSHTSNERSNVEESRHSDVKEEKGLAYPPTGDTNLHDYPDKPWSRHSDVKEEKGLAYPPTGDTNLYDYPDKPWSRHSDVKEEKGLAETREYYGSIAQNHGCDHSGCEKSENRKYPYVYPHRIECHEVEDWGLGQDDEIAMFVSDGYRWLKIWPEAEDELYEITDGEHVVFPPSFKREVIGHRANSADWGALGWGSKTYCLWEYDGSTQDEKIGCQEFKLEDYEHNCYDDPDYIDTKTVNWNGGGSDYVVTFYIECWDR